MKTITIHPMSIIVDNELQARDKTKQSVIRSYARVIRERGINEFPPITVACTKDSETPVLIDGFHRLAAARAVALDAIPIVHLGALSREEMKYQAAALNLSHGQRLGTKKEIHEVLDRYMKAGRWQDGRGGRKGWRTIAAELKGIRSWGGVRSWTQKHHPEIFRIGSEADPEDRFELEEGSPGDAEARHMRDEAINFSKAASRAIEAGRGQDVTLTLSRLVVELQEETGERIAVTAAEIEALEERLGLRSPDDDF